MRILHVIPYFNKKFGGVLNVCINECQYLSKQGHNVTIITTDYDIDNDLVNEVSNLNIKIIIFKKLFNAYLYIYTPFLNKWARNNIKNYDIIHMHEFRSYQNIAIAKNAKRQNIPYCVQPHGSIKTTIGRKNYKKIFDLFFGKYIANNANKIICITENETDDCLVFREENDIILIPNGINCFQVDTHTTKNEFKEILGLESDTSYILYLGRIHPSKGLALLINAFSLVSATVPNAKLIIAGPDFNYKNKLLDTVRQLGIRDRVIFYDFVDEKCKTYLLRASDIFVTPTYSGFPVAFLEAGLNALPIVTTNVGDRLLLLDVGGIVTENSPESIGDGIVGLMSNKDLMVEMGDKIQTCIRSNFCWENIGCLLEQSYMGIMKK